MRDNPLSNIVAARFQDGSTSHEEELMEALKSADREVVSSRVFAAPREVLFRAFSDPAVLARWWGPSGFTNRFEVFELRADGAWRFTMVGPDGVEYPTVSAFEDVVPPERIVFWHLEPGHRFRMTMTFDVEGAGTRVTWRMEFDSAAEVERVGKLVTEGNEQNFDRLAAEVAGMG
jgi:uncharacterized protein YndB with AHSA1/START domain